MIFSNRNEICDKIRNNKIMRYLLLCSQHTKLIFYEYFCGTRIKMERYSTQIHNNSYLIKHLFDFYMYIKRSINEFALHSDYYLELISTMLL